MFKKALGICALVAVFATTGVFLGCTPEQQKAIAKQLGLASAVSWIGIDNPQPEDIATVKTVVTVIQTACCTDCSDADSYYARAYPIVDQYITEKVPANKQAMARLGASFILTSLDTAFAMNPSWKANSDTATGIIVAYCEGVSNGLSLSASNPVRVAACRQAPLRATLVRPVK